MMLPEDRHWTKGLWRGKALHIVLRPFMSVFFRVRNGFHYKAYKPKDKTFLLLTNHNSSVDHFLNALGIRSYVRFVVSDHLLRKGIGSKVLRYLVNPIPRRKASSGEPTVKMIQQNLRLGIPVIMYAEGNRSFNGRTGFISPRTGQLVKDSVGSLITYRIDGAYMQTPRWGHMLRKGPTFGTAVHEYSRDEINKMTIDEINRHIQEDLYSDAYAFQRKYHYTYKCSTRAEYLETTLFVCPECQKTGNLASNGNSFSCTCGMHATVNEQGFIENAKFDNVYDWDMWQRGIMRTKVEDARGLNTILSSDNGEIRLYHVDGDTKTLIGSDLTSSISCESFVLTGADQRFEFSLPDIKSMACAFTSVLFMKVGEEYYELRGNARWPANKYFAYHRMINRLEYI